MNKIYFRVAVLSSLIMIAVLFAAHGRICGPQSENEQHSLGYHSLQTVECDGPLGIGPEGWTAIFTGGLFLFTVTLAVATIRLFQVTKDGIAEQAELTRAAVSHAHQSAKAAARQAANSTAVGRAHIRVERFRAVVDQMIFESWPPGEESLSTELRYSFVLKNYGSSPAEILSVAFCAFCDFTANSAVPRVIEARETTIGTGQQSSIYSGSFPLIVERFRQNEIIRRQGFLWFKVDVTYYDVFGDLQGEEVSWRYDSVRIGWPRRPLLAGIDRRPVAERQPQ